MFGVMQHLNVTLCKDAADAVAKGYKYEKPEYRPISISEVVIVQDGTVGHNPTVDLVLEDEAGNKFVVMVTGNLLKSLPL